jgi:catechol 2,3-dioxygenase-like lactoylglutathione lyase family enzyme
MPPHLTHVAIRAHDIDASLDFYRRFVGLHLVHDRVDNGVRVVWLSEEAEDPAFVIVIIGVPPEPTGPASLAEHLGYDLPSREAVDEIAARGAREGLLLQGPTDAGPIVGYICMLRDPDGNVIEFSHGQPINPKRLRLVGSEC